MLRQPRRGPPARHPRRGASRRIRRAIAYRSAIDAFATRERIDIAIPCPLHQCRTPSPSSPSHPTPSTGRWDASQGSVIRTWTSANTVVPPADNIHYPNSGRYRMSARLPFTKRYAGLAADEYGTAGDTPPIVLLHGISFDRTMWRPALVDLRAIDPDRRALAFALPGHGDLPDATSSRRGRPRRRPLGDRRCRARWRRSSSGTRPPEGGRDVRVAISLVGGCHRPTALPGRRLRRAWRAVDGEGRSRARPSLTCGHGSRAGVSASTRWRADVRGLRHRTTGREPGWPSDPG